MGNGNNDRVDRAFDVLMGLVIEAAEDYDQAHTADQADCDEMVERYLARVGQDQESTIAVNEVLRLVDQFLNDDDVTSMQINLPIVTETHDGESKATTEEMMNQLDQMLKNAWW